MYSFISLDGPMPRKKKDRADSAERFRKVSTRLWADENFRALSPPEPSGQFLWLYLLVGPHVGPIPGVFSVGRFALAESLRWVGEPNPEPNPGLVPVCSGTNPVHGPVHGSDLFRNNEGTSVSHGVHGRYLQALREIEERGMLIADWQAPLCWLPHALAHNWPRNSNTVKGWLPYWRELPECELKAVIHQAFTEAFAAHANLASAFLAFPVKGGGRTRPRNKPEPNPELVPEQTGTKPGTGPGTNPEQTRTKEKEKEKEKENLSPQTPQTDGMHRRSVLPCERPDLVPEAKRLAALYQERVKPAGSPAAALAALTDTLARGATPAEIEKAIAGYVAHCQAQGLFGRFRLSAKNFFAEDEPWRAYLARPVVAQDPGSLPPGHAPREGRPAVLADPEEVSRKFSERRAIKKDPAVAAGVPPDGKTPGPTPRAPDAPAGR